MTITPINPMVETYRLTVEHYVATSKGERIKVEDNKRYEFSFCHGSSNEVFGMRNHAINELMFMAQRELINDLREDEQKNENIQM